MITCKSRYSSGFCAIDGQYCTRMEAMICKGLPWMLGAATIAVGTLAAWLAWKCVEELSK